MHNNFLIKRRFFNNFFKLENKFKKNVKIKKKIKIN